MPVWIPSREGYFASAVEIFRISFQSLLATVDPDQVSITVIDNGCVPEVTAIIQEAFAEGLIDRLIRHAVNRGKPDAVASELVASFEPFVTLADADVLFLHGWLPAIEELFLAWPNAGAVSPSAQPNTAFYFNRATWFYGAASGQLRRGKFVSDQDMRQFANSCGNPGLYSKKDLHRQFALSRKGKVALVGGGHFVITLRRCCYNGFHYRPRLEGTGHGMRSIDAPVDQNGWLRLSNTRAHVLHLGNTPEPWMHNRLKEVLAAAPHRLADLESDIAHPRRTKWPWLNNTPARGLSQCIQLLARVINKYS